MLGALAIVCGCERPEAASLATASVGTATRRATIRVRARTETGSPVRSADVFAGATLVARTNEGGLASIEVGSDRDTFYVRVDCPSSYRSPNRPLAVRRTEIVGGVRDYDVVCQELQHAWVVTAGAEGAKGAVGDVLDHDDIQELSSTFTRDVKKAAPRESSLAITTF
jgi:hypothetical protein